ncbi:MAG: sodium:proton antiporter [Chlorobi bacterium]|nr:sodium:proton antiporter [Chlorobiota bacterium]
MIPWILVAIFVIGYILIATEHNLEIDKTVPALVMAAVLWTILSMAFKAGWIQVIDAEGVIYKYADGETATEAFKNILMHHLAKISEILIFLLGAMTIVELIDLHRGFEIIKLKIKTDSRRKLLWIIGFLAFFLSAVIDNLTATIVLVTLLRKLIHDHKSRIWYASMIVIAANAGGAWSPIGDVTTTMLWIAHKISVGGLIEHVIAPSLLNFFVPMIIVSRFKVFNGKLNIHPQNGEKKIERLELLLSSKTMLIVGLGSIVMVPVFKVITHLPPYMGMMLALGIVWLVSEIVHPEEQFDKERKHLYSAHTALSRIEMASILFFLGILLAVAALETIYWGEIPGEGGGMIHANALQYLAYKLSLVFNEEVLIILLGILSAIIDNVPLVAATMSMFDWPMDHIYWHQIAYSAGTGGSILIIGSAAGVAAMGMEKIEFFWYLRNISWLAFLGFITGFITFAIEYWLL